jgi:hypothetical protein
MGQASQHQLTLKEKETPDMGQIATLYKTGTANLLDPNNPQIPTSRHNPQDEPLIIELTHNPNHPSSHNFTPTDRYILIIEETLQNYLSRTQQKLETTTTGQLALNGNPIDTIRVEEADFEYPGEPEHGGWCIPSETCCILLNNLHQLWGAVTYTAQTLNTPIPEDITNTVANLSIYSPDAESSIERISSWALAEWEKHPDKSAYVPDDFGSESLNPFSVFTETIPERIHRTRGVAMNCARSIQNNLSVPRSLNAVDGITAEDVAEPPF